MKSVICMSYCKPGLGDPLTPLVNLIVNLSTTEVYIYMAFFSTRRLAHIWSARRDLTANKRRAALERRCTARPHGKQTASCSREAAHRGTTTFKCACSMASQERCAAVDCDQCTYATRGFFIARRGRASEGEKAQPLCNLTARVLHALLFFSQPPCPSHPITHPTSQTG